jgi:hypothetical protein
VGESLSTSVESLLGWMRARGSAAVRGATFDSLVDGLRALEAEGVLQLEDDFGAVSPATMVHNLT